MCSPKMYIYASVQCIEIIYVKKPKLKNVKKVIADRKCGIYAGVQFIKIILKAQIEKNVK